ncbi:MAG: L-iditol 2-dehydrogenase [SAR324 cluster bacterium]|nr:L-iditol 2-dehydrogenase [SAR324 cluster bacterium]
MKLKNKIAIVTGSANGIGRAIAERYIQEGATVIIADIDIEAAQETADILGAKAMQFNVVEQASIDNLLGRVLQEFGPVNILVNNAALFSMAPILEITREQYRKIFDVNVEGLLFMLQSVARQMIDNKVKGKIINMSSQAGRRGEALVAVYCASKAAVISLTQSAGLALIKEGINVNGISPGVVDTPMWEQVDALFAKYEGLQLGEKKRMVGDAVPYGRMGTPEDLTGAAVFLASEDANYIVAQTLNVDGGNWMS